jgi:uncharacterized integral membrane protein (TIGR00698 family)
MAERLSASLSASLSKEALLSLGSMEGVYQLPVVEKRLPSVKPLVKELPAWPGWTAALLTAGLAYAIHYLPFPPFRVSGEFGVRRPVSAAILAIVAGALARNFFPLESAAAGAKNVVQRVLPLTIILSGAGLSFANIQAVGPRAFGVILATMTVAMGGAWVLGQIFGLSKRASVLLGAGTAICGNSAIVAVAPLIDAEDRDVLVSVGAINLLGLAMMFAVPVAGGWLSMPEQAYGVWAGTTIHAVPQAVAAGFAFGQHAGALATLIKLVRVALLAPLIVVLAAGYAHRNRSKLAIRYSRLAPPFLWGFLGLFLLNSLQLLPTLQFASGFSVVLASALSEVGNILLALAMAALGLEVNARLLVKTGGAALMAGAAAALLLCAASYTLIWLWL